jgi:phosphoserine phosphatase RsbU/P
MLQRVVFIFLLLAAPAIAGAQANFPVRYHYGDDARWALPSFDDSSWPLASNGVWPSPPFASDGFVWVRLRVALPGGIAEPLAAREARFRSAPAVSAVYIDGVLAGSNGALPPHPAVWTAPPHLVFLLPASVAHSADTHPSGTAVIAVRAWIPPDARSGEVYASEFTIDRAGTQAALARDARNSLLLRELPILIVGLLLVLLGFALLALGIRTRRRELLLFAVVLIAGPLQADFYLLTYSGPLPVPIGVYAAISSVLLCAVPVSYLQFLWEALALGAPGWKYAAWAASALAALAFWIHSIGQEPGALVALALHTELVAGSVRDLLESGAAIWALIYRRSGRFLAFAILLTPLTSFLDMIAPYLGRNWENITDWIFYIAVLVGGLLIAAILLWRAWNAWKTGERLNVELSAAREIQQRLIPESLPALADFRVQAAYLPAAEVGGDFYQLLHQPAGGQPDGPALIVVGDVSGKGLKAAMTGALAIGALRALAQENLSPAEILIRLNLQLAGSQAFGSGLLSAGFVTCLCARIAGDGAVTLANAGHLAPYLDGEEVSIAGSLPLGLSADAEYTETALRLKPGDTLTFLSDGVVEAQNAQGELFGFDRAGQLSTLSAEQIAQAACAFGQQDDISVLTLTYVPGGG